MERALKHPPEIIEQIRIWWATGEYSAEQIGNAVGLNKNQVIGQINRGREWEGEARWRKSAPGKRVPRTSWSGIGTPLEPIKAKPVVRTPKPAKPVTAAPEPFNTKRIKFRDRSLSQCAYPLEGEGAGMVVCGRSVEPGFSWCGYHLNVVTAEPRRRRRIA